MAWPNNPRPAKSLVILRDRINKLYPNRSKKSDGMIGDAAHASRQSDHNPDAKGIVKAWDVTHDPKDGPDLNWLASCLIKDPRTNYVIYNRRIWQNGAWKAYTGSSDPHTNHLHLSVKASNCDDASPWNIELKEEPMVTDKQIDDTINQARILAGFPESDLNTFLKVYRPELKNNYAAGVMTMFDNLIKDPKSAQNVLKTATSPALVKLAEAIRELK